MPTTTLCPHLVRFAEFELDLQSGELRRSDERVLLPDQLFRVLALLIRRPGELITRDDLRRELWADGTFVDFEHGLNAAIKRLRVVLGDSAATPRFIETLPRRGYRFIAAVEVAAGSAADEPQRARPAAPALARAGRPPLVAGGLLVAALSVAVGAVIPSLKSSSASRSAAPARATSTAGVNFDPALSPDGTLLAYASDRAGAGDLDIWVQPVAGGEAARLTTDPADDVDPSFSPDGSHIAFSRREAGGVYEIATVGGEPRLIVRALRARTPRYSPDGQWIAYWTGLSASVVGTGSKIGSLFVVPSGGGRSRRLRADFDNARYPVWSPDGRRILFLGERADAPDAYDWYLTSRDGGEAIKTGAAAAFRAAGVDAGVPIPGAWRAEGDLVLFATNGRDSSNIWQIPISTSTGRARGVPERVTFGSALERAPTASASGALAFSNVAENVDLWRLRLGADGTQSGALERLTDNAAVDRLPSLSRDGTLVAFISSRTGREEVWVRNLQTGRDRQLTREGADAASISPDGSRVAFSAGTLPVLRIVDVASGLTSTVCEGCDEPWAWSPDGRQLLFRRGAPASVMTYDLPSGHRNEILADATRDVFQPRVSPDGRWIAFHTADAPNVRRIYVAPFSPEERIPVRDWIEVVSDSGVMPRWSADGASLYYFSFRDGAFCAWMQALDPSSRRPVGAPRAIRHFHGARLRAALGAPPTSDVHGGFLYVTLTETRANVWMIGGRP